MGLELLFALSCSELNLRPDACQSAIKAASIQTGLYSNYSLIETKFFEEAHKNIKKHVFSYTGESVWIFTGAAIKVVREKEIGYDWNVESEWIDNVEARIGKDRGYLNLRWELK